jgi:hypothetical protein
MRVNAKNIERKLQNPLSLQKNFAFYHYIIRIVAINSYFFLNLTDKDDFLCK